MSTGSNRRDPRHYRGCLLGGAVGDALGAPVEFLTLAGIRAAYGPGGITDFDGTRGQIGEITDDTQMTLFTAEGLLRANSRWHERGICHPPGVVYGAYLRWLHTQGVKIPSDRGRARLDGWLVHVPELHARRAPGNTCLSALRSGRMGSVEAPVNDSKGCGGVMRAAPVGLIAHEGTVFDLGCETAAITHGHPSGYLAAGSLASIIHEITEGRSLEDAIGRALAILEERPGSEECSRAIESAVDAAHAGSTSAGRVERLGAGWVAEEALAIALYCALVAGDDLAAGVRLAVNHSGDSDSTGAITGNLLGALLGEGAIPPEWLERLELRDVIAQVAEDLCAGWRDDDAWLERYPPR